MSEKVTYGELEPETVFAVLAHEKRTHGEPLRYYLWRKRADGMAEIFDGFENETDRLVWNARPDRHVSGMDPEWEVIVIATRPRT